MKVADSFLSLKLETLQILMAVQDPAKLQRVRAVLEESEPTPQHLLDLIKRRQEEAKSGLGRPVEEFLEEIKDL
ncbi:MAG: hypothetical protein RLZZ519_2990 [Bacteroidota bacterium]|jgi:hypothetical protein